MAVKYNVLLFELGFEQMQEENDETQRSTVVCCVVDCRDDIDGLWGRHAHHSAATDQGSGGNQGPGSDQSARGDDGAARNRRW